jgi:hypothetical protein
VISANFTTLMAEKLKNVSSMSIGAGVGYCIKEKIRVIAVKDFIVLMQNNWKG